MTTPQWLRHFKLSVSPFSKDLADDDLWLPSSKVALIDRLVDAIDERQHVLLVGEPGVGKTCALRALRRRLPEAGYKLTYCHNATLGKRDFYRQLCLAMGLEAKATAAGVFYAISSHVEELGRERVHPVFLLDESHLLRQEVLDHLHVLSNYHWDAKPLLSLVLVGLPELWDRLKLARNRSLWSRIHSRIRIDDASDEDTVEYICHRLEQAGAAPTVIGSDALTMIHEATAGRLRDVDRIATLALKSAARRKLKSVDRDVVRGLLDDD